MPEEGNPNQHTSPEARRWVEHILRCAEGCTIVTGGKTHCQEGARLYIEMRPEVASDGAPVR